MTLDDFQLRAIPVPFKVRGRDWFGWDCWGLIFVAYRDVFGRPVPSYAPQYDAGLSYSEISALIEVERALEWRSVPVADVLPGDVGLYRVGPHQTHVSLVLSGFRMIHCEHRAGTLIERLDSLIWAGRNVGYYRRID